MRLLKFRIRLFRSIVDSGEVTVGHMAALIGKNESGKTNVLMALEALDATEALLSSEELTIGHSLLEFEGTPDFLVTTWALDDADRKAIDSIWPRGSTVTQLALYKHYNDATRYFLFEGAVQPNALYDEATGELDKMANSFGKSPALLPHKDALLGPLGVVIKTDKPGENWSTSVSDAISNFRTAAELGGLRLPVGLRKSLNRIAEIARLTTESKDSKLKAYQALRARMPRFVYLDDYPDPVGRQNLVEYAERVTQSKLDESDVRFERLMALAGIDRSTLLGLQELGRRQRDRLLNEASVRLTRRFRSLWKFSVDIRLALDNSEIDTIVSLHAENKAYELNLEDRSKGFRWAFAFVAAFATTGQEEIAPVLLLDEPGVHLHAAAQGELLRFLREEVPNQIIYTTHSPYMVDPEHLEDVRVVQYRPNSGTTVSSEISGDRDTLFPLQAALGLSLAQSLFVGANHLLVEGVTDLWFLSSLSEFLNDIDGTGISSDVVITPAGGASRIAVLAAFLSSHGLKCVALFDSEAESLRVAQEDIRKKLLRQEGIIFVAEAMDGAQAEADLEDLFNPDDYQAVVSEAFAQELADHPIALNANVPRISRRNELSFTASGLDFNKTRPAKLLLRKLAARQIVLDNQTLDRFRRLCQSINSAFDRIQGRANFEQGVRI